jgi:proteasome-associated ATPase
MAGIAKSGRSHFINIKPGTLNSMWFGQTEANYREAFRTAREASELEKDVPVIVFIDEIDSIGAARGASLMRVDDRVLTSFMAELDGFEDRGNVLVVAATNRRDALDPALLRPGRLGDLVIEIPRPNRKAAAAIFDRYLRRGIPYARDGHGDDLEATRLDIIQTALSRIFAPNSDNRLATLTFRDGKQIAVTAKDLISGAGISKIVQAAVERACFREIQTGEPGVSLSDVLTAIHEEFQSASRVLTPANCHKHLSTLPQDVDVVRVDLPKHKGPRHRYIATA